MDADHYYAFMHPFQPNSRMRTRLKRTEKVQNNFKNPCLSIKKSAEERRLEYQNKLATGASYGTG